MRCESVWRVFRWFCFGFISFFGGWGAMRCESVWLIFRWSCVVLCCPVLSCPVLCCAVLPSAVLSEQDYLAPEMLMERPYTTSVDLWAAGVVTYEFLLGHSPFRRQGLVCYWCAIGMLLVCYWCAIGMPLVCHWYAMDMLCVCYWYAGNMLVVC